MGKLYLYIVDHPSTLSLANIFFYMTKRNDLLFTNLTNKLLTKKQLRKLKN
jgi:hypothetical protein